MARSLTQFLQRAENQLILEYKLLRDMEDLEMRQRAEEDWLIFRDRCSKAKNKSAISEINDTEGNKVKGKAEVSRVFEKYCYDSVGSQKYSILTAEILEMLPFSSFNSQYYEVLIEEVSEEEIKEIVFTLDSNKILGLGGYNGFSFKSCWTTIGNEVSTAIKHVFKTRSIRGGVNATHLRLILKTHNPASVGDCLPIACCNVLYKINAKLISNRFKLVLSKVLSPSQIVFLPGQNTQDNLLLAHEIVRGYNRKDDEKRISIKIDKKRGL